MTSFLSIVHVRRFIERLMPREFSEAGVSVVTLHRTDVRSLIPSRSRPIHSLRDILKASDTSDLNHNGRLYLILMIQGGSLTG